MAASPRRRDLRRLRLWLALFFCALALPAGLLTLKAYDQLKWEALRQSQLAAEELVAGIDGRLGALIRAADARSFTDFAFLTLAGDPSAGFVARSPLSAFPPSDEPAVPIPGLIGWFQVDDRGRLSTPLLPRDGTDVGRYGIPAEELPGRQALEERISTILDQNALVPRVLPPPMEEQIAASADEDAERKLASAGREAAALEMAPAAAFASPAPVIEESVAPRPADQPVASRSTEPYAAQAEPASIQSQVAFDRLARSDEAPRQGRRQVAGAIASLDELELDDVYSARRAEDKASAAVKAEVGADQAEQGLGGLAPRRSRKELAALPEPVPRFKADVGAGDALGAAALKAKAAVDRDGAAVPSAQGLTRAPALQRLRGAGGGPGRRRPALGRAGSDGRPRLGSGHRA